MTVKSECTPGRIYRKVEAVHHGYMAKRAVPRPKRPQYRRTFIRQWREHRELTLEYVAERIAELLPTEKGFTHASLSRIERGLQPYSQPILEALAIALNTEPASLLIRDPGDPEAIWSVWEAASQGDKKKIVDIARTITGKTGTDG